ncbi:BolA domain UV induced protein Uvi31 [Spiromyces aspiralis]|uniref:BolA domain UV induced protein Uvi31 n=1 Tax=Spiromyces aspiralis TaxID=68401 RepID=A0ACC1HIB7_9FUNG|nr:BolA domain UV induced protein Uvi31 [Spiromyces aspiralis]
MSSLEATPIADAIREKITQDLKPQEFEIINESHKHRHHAPMKGVTSRETHFKLKIVSENKVYIRTTTDHQNYCCMTPTIQNQIQRHRHVYSLLDRELKMENGIHALAIIAKTPEEDGKAPATTPHDPNMPTNCKPST